MNTRDLADLYVKLLDILRKGAPWAAEQVELTIREGKPVTRQISRSKRGVGAVADVFATERLRDNQHVATEELTASERASIVMIAVERLLVDPPQIEQAMRETMTSVSVNDVLFAEPTAEAVGSTEIVKVMSSHRERLVALLARVTSEVESVG